MSAPTFQSLRRDNGSRPDAGLSGRGNVAGRYVHLVGSLPGTTAHEARSTAIRILGGRLHSPPDGETADLRNWIISIVEACAVLRT